METFDAPLMFQGIQQRGLSAATRTDENNVFRYHSPHRMNTNDEELHCTFTADADATALYPSHRTANILCPAIITLIEMVSRSNQSPSICRRTAPVSTRCS